MHYFLYNGSTIVLVLGEDQSDQIGRFIGLWFKALGRNYQICPNLLHS